MQFVRPLVSDIVVGDASSNGTVVSLRANAYFTADVAMTATQSVAGTNTATLTWTPTTGSTGAAPASTQILSKCVVSGLATGIGSNNTETEILIYTGSTGGTLVFSTGGATGATVTINGAYT